VAIVGTSEGVEGATARRRVLLLGSYAPSLINFRGPLVEAMVARGHQVIAAAPAIDDVTAARLRAIGAEPLSVPLSNTSLNPAELFRSYRALRQALRDHRPDTIIGYTIKPVVVGALAGRAEGLRVVSLITGLGFAFTGEEVRGRRGLIRRAAALLYRAAIARSDVILFQNPDDRALFRQMRVLAPNREAFIVDGSGVDIDRFEPAPLPATLSFLMIARLLRDKGVREYAAAASRLRTEHPDIRVVLVGYLDASPDSLTAADLGDIAAAGVEFVGKLDDVRPAIAQASVYVLPSYREGTPRSVLEAMAMGRPIITTDAPGCRETVAEGVNGFLVRVRDPVSLYSAMKRFVDDPRLAAQMGAASREIAERRYDARKVAADVLEHAGL
jgi:glycosyltransferase involved in cell wall biosynthesis